MASAPARATIRASTGLVIPQILILNNVLIRLRKPSGLLGAGRAFHSRVYSIRNFRPLSVRGGRPEKLETEGDRG